MNLTFPLATRSDAEMLVAIRIAAMRDSSSASAALIPSVRATVSRRSGAMPLDRSRRRERGLFVVRPQEDHWLLDHLYIVPEHQGKGSRGGAARSLPTPIRSRCPFASARCAAAIRTVSMPGTVSQADEAEWDIYYVRAPGSATV